MTIDLRKLVIDAHAQAIKSSFWGIWKQTVNAGANKADLSTSFRALPVSMICLKCGAEAHAGSLLTEGERADCITCNAIDNPELRDEDFKVMLIVGELSEAAEEYRLTPEQRGGGLGDILYETVIGRQTLAQLSPSYDDEGNQTSVGLDASKLKPVGFVVELADTAIRLADLCGRKGWSLEPNAGTLAMQRDPFTRQATLPFLMRNTAQAISLIDCAAKDKVIGERLPPVIFAFLQGIAERVGGDLETAIELKMKYNTTRAHLHGKAL